MKKKVLALVAFGLLALASFGFATSASYMLCGASCCGACEVK